MDLTQEQKKKIKKERDAKYYQENKEKIKERVRQYSINNPHIGLASGRKFRKNNPKKCAEYSYKYHHTPAGIKSQMMNKWRGRGVINVDDEMYNNYINTTCCDVCKNEFKDSSDRCLDHNHTTGEFRQILCRGCNTKDNWINYQKN